MKTELVKGFRDYSGDEARKREKIKQILVETFKAYGFEPAETPVIEYEEFVRGDNTQDEAVSDIFKLKDKGKRNLALRYEFTFQLKRLAKGKKLPYKRYQIGEVFRDEPVSSNRFRQFTQADIDIIGSTIKDESEILKITSEIMKKLNIKPIININNRKLLNEILDKEKIKNKEQVIRIIDKLDKQPENKVKKELKKYKAESVLNIIKSKEKCKKYKTYSEIQDLINYCKLYNLKINFQPSLARGLSYYNGSVFEVKTKEMKETICAGGSYLINNIQSTGLAFGIERLCFLSKINLESNNLLIISINQDKSAINLAEKLRKQGKNISLYYGKPSKALEYANSKKIPYVIFIGDKEIKSGKYKLKNMKTGKESLVSEKELDNTNSL